MKTVHLPVCFVLTLIQIICLYGPISGAAYGDSRDGSPEVSVQELIVPVTNTDANAVFTQSDSFSANNTKADKPTKPEPNMKLAGFFFIGLIINLLVLAVFASWAYKQWKKRP